MLRFSGRVSDYNKNTGDGSGSKPLLKDMSLFRRTTAPKSGGGNSWGPYQKKEKIYYLAPHSYAEYFALEILNILGLYAPKGRFVQVAPSEVESKPVIAVNALNDYLPIISVRQDIFLLSNFSSSQSGACLNLNELFNNRVQYRLNLKRQVVVEVKSGKEFKISGPLFSADILAALVCDEDFQPDGNNFGLVRRGKRFFASAIDKDRARFEGRSYAELLAIMNHVLKDELFSFKTFEQELAVVTSVHDALKIERDGLCVFDRIFRNPRVMATPVLAQLGHQYVELFKQSAASLLTHYTERHGDNFLAGYRQRESIRERIALKVVRQLPGDYTMAESEMRMRHIVEDLRAPYYQEYYLDQDSKVLVEADLNNPILANKIVQDICAEFDLSLQAELQSDERLPMARL
jgi:hypothetical protein